MGKIPTTAIQQRPFNEADVGELSALKTYSGDAEYRLAFGKYTGCGNYEISFVSAITTLLPYSVVIFCGARTCLVAGQCLPSEYRTRGLLGE